MMMTWKNVSGYGRKMAAAAAVGSLLVVQGCAGGNLKQYNDPTDTCNVHRQPIINAEKTEWQKQIESAVVGAAIGAILVGGIAAATGSNNWGQAALIGAAAGGLVGFSKSYFENRAKRAKTQAELETFIRNDISVERAQLTQVSQSVQSLRNCRRREINQIREDFETGKASKEVARARLTNVQAKIAQDNELISKAFNGIDGRVTAYVDASAATTKTEKSIIVADAAERKKKRRAATRSSTPTSGAATASATPAPSSSGGSVNDNAADVVVERDLAKDEEKLSRAEIDEEVKAMEILLG